MSEGAATVPLHEVRARFAAALAEMYRHEVPLYDRLLTLVAEVNAAASSHPLLGRTRGRIDRERHGAIRVGTAAELRWIARAFALLGMEPVGYYDLAPAGLPIHSTAFRSIGTAALDASPFRMFTSLLRLDMIEPAAVREAAGELLQRRQIHSAEADRLLVLGERQGGLSDADADRFCAALLDTFRWHEEATVGSGLYAGLIASHRLVADVAAFRGPHVNHLTPRVLDIDQAQQRMLDDGFAPKQIVEGPPRRTCPLLLRQTSFAARSEPVRFADGVPGTHVARFGEVEQRGAALTPAGRHLYDRWLIEGGDLGTLLPDDWDALRRQRLAFFRYAAADPARPRPPRSRRELPRLIERGEISVTPILYEDFLPVSAAGIFRSNLDTASTAAPPYDRERESRSDLEAAVGRPILDEMKLYATEEERSLDQLFGPEMEDDLHTA